jgi:multicomponent K+:H+ antiporter subunit E
MKKLLLLLILSFFSAQSFAGSCPDGSEPVKSISDDGTFFVYNCGGSAKSSSKTSNNTVASPKVKPKELEGNLTFVGEFDLKKLGENKNQNLFAFSVHGETFDINQDGHDDLIIPIASLNSKFRNVPNEFSKPVLLFWDDSLKKYVVEKEVQKALPLLYWPRRFRSSINPKTGFTEIFVADMGLDLAGYDFSKGMENLPPNCGGQNHLITFDPSSGKVAEIPLPKIWDVSHGLAAGDLNGDQVADYVLLNSPYIKYPAKCQYNGLDYTNESYILYSNNKGGFDKVDIKLNYKGYSKAPSIQSGEVIVDENNQSYLVLGSEGGKGDAYLYLMKQDSQTSFTETSKVKAPEILKTVGAPVYGEIFVTDIDGDGTEEVIAASNTVDESIAMWVGRYVQIFDIKNGQFKEREDEMTQSPSSKVLPHPILSVTLWVFWLLLNNTLAPGHIVLGFFLAITIPLFTAGFWPEKVRIKAPLTLLKFLALVMWDILIANLMVAKLVLGRNDSLKPAFFHIALDIENSLGISVLSNTISLTPGTVSCDLTADGKCLMVHALHAENISELVEHIKQRYEAPLIKVFTSC